jgi:hypothetical protein
MVSRADMKSKDSKRADCVVLQVALVAYDGPAGTAPAWRDVFCLTIYSTGGD